MSNNTESPSSNKIIKIPRLKVHCLILHCFRSQVNHHYPAESYTRFLLVEVGAYPPFHEFITKCTEIFTVDVDSFIERIKRLRFHGGGSQGFALADGIVS